MSFEKQKLIMLPGPTNVSERVMKAMTRPIINHRGPEFAKLFLGLREKARSLFQTEGEVILFSSSGTGGVEAAVWNIIRKGDTAIVPVFGEFSERLAETIELAGGRAVRVKAEYGTTPTLAQLARAIEARKEFRALFLVHNETSTGAAVQYVEEASRLARAHDAFVVVDAISSLGGYSIPVDGWGIDLCATASQKCIAAPPGMALVSVSDRLLKYVKKSPTATRYFDIARYSEYGSRGETPFTPSLPIFYALDEALEELREEGLGTRVKRHEVSSAALYSGLGKLGLKFFAETEARSRTVVAVRYPAGVDDALFRKKLREEHGILVAGGFGPFKGKMFRVGCMGLVSEEFVDATLDAVEKTLKTVRGGTK
jgi:aspartate aminotransferase-like enzyme